MDIKANTTQICDEADKVVTEDTAKALGTQIGLMIAARQNHRTADEAAAKAKAKAQVNDWAKQLRDLSTKAADPALATALNSTADAVAKLGSDDYLASIKTVSDADKIDTDLTNAGAAAMTKVCG